MCLYYDLRTISTNFLQQANEYHFDTTYAITLDNDVATSKVSIDPQSM